MPKQSVYIDTLQSVNGFDFGISTRQLIAQLGPPDEALENYTGELELLFGDTFYRFSADHLVECTLPDSYQFVVNGVEILSVFTWLGSLPDHVDKAMFRVSAAAGMAYDYRPLAAADGVSKRRNANSITVFETGRWDTLLSLEKN